MLTPDAIKYKKMKHLFLLFFISPVFIAAKTMHVTDSTKQKNIEYDINDPRNPNCPCHKYQQQAEKEYKDYLLTENNDSPAVTKGASQSVSMEKKRSLRGRESRSWERYSFKAKKRFNKTFYRVRKRKADYEKCSF